MTDLTTVKLSMAPFELSSAWTLKVSRSSSGLRLHRLFESDSGSIGMVCVGR